ncbi:MAG: aromatic acid exporter family protein [Enterococcus sp.]
MKIGLRTIKTAIGATVAMASAFALGLLYAPAAGIIAILSVGNTKKATIKTGGLRLISLAIATIIAYGCFMILGFNPIAFGVYLLLFIPLSVFFELQEGIVVNSVLVTHYLSEKSFSGALLYNELLLMSLGVGVAWLLNLYMPDLAQGLKKDQAKIEADFRFLLIQLADCLNQPATNELHQQYEQLKSFIQQAHATSKRYSDNHWQSETNYYEEYFTMRRIQLNLIGEMLQLLEKIAVEETFVTGMRELILQTAQTFDEKNDGYELTWLQLQIYEEYREQPLPQTRDEFENRALLFQLLQVFASFIEVKKAFADQTIIKSHANQSVKKW